ncbi:MAG: uroporphyrinogen decarboxylase family protein [Anaerolineae bacterium]|jgi:uroporphyrinogen decarboxylase|nr:uroporphyrinogen decarboxylase family protein [Anaerolineae bacterium]
MTVGAKLSSRERVRLALAHKTTDRIPIAMVCAGINPPAAGAVDELLQRTRNINLQRWLNSFIDIRGVAPRYIGPPLPPGEDIWGVRRAPVSYGSGAYDEIAGYPLAEAQSPADLARHPWPTTDWFDYPSLLNSIASAQADGEHCLMVSNGNIFESAWYMRGFERLLLDFAIHPDLAYALLERVADFHIMHFRRMLEVADGAVDLTFTADDIAGQRGLLLSLDMWERFIKPHHVRLNKTIHEFGVKVIYHSDGGVTRAVPGLIDMGIDVLQALQFSARGMDPASLKRDFGDRLCFEGGVSVQTTLPFGTTDAVRSETEMLISVLGTDGGYILGPSHAIQAGTPPENVLAMFDTALGFYPH